MSICVIGIDCATNNAKIGIAWGRFTSNKMNVQDAVRCSRTLNPLDTIVDWVKQEAEPTLLAIDAPLGWPSQLSNALRSHSAGEEIQTEPNTMFRRETDRFIYSKLKKTPLDVGADRIARTAHSALALLGALRRQLKQAVPLAWSPALPRGVSAIEVYPAATLIAHGINAAGYKKSGQKEGQNRIIKSLHLHLSFSKKIPIIGESADALDAVICLLSGADFLQGRAVNPPDPELAKKEGWIWVSLPKKTG